MTRSRGANPAKRQRGKSGSSNKQSRLSTSKNDETGMGGMDRKIGSRLFDVPGELLDMCFGVQVGLELRDYVALAGTCRFVRDRFSDEVWQDLYFHFRQHRSQSSSLPLEYHDPLSILPASSRIPNFVRIFDRLPPSPPAPIQHYRPPGDRSTWTINQYLTYKRARAAAKDKMLYDLREEERWRRTKVRLEEGVVWYHGGKRDRVGLIPAKRSGKAPGPKAARKGKVTTSEPTTAGGDVGGESRVGEGRPEAEVKATISVVPVIDLTGDDPVTEVGTVQETDAQDRGSVIPIIDLTIDTPGADGAQSDSTNSTIPNAAPIAHGSTKSRYRFKRTIHSPDNGDHHSSTSSRSRSSSGSKTPDLRALFFKPVPAETDESDLELTRQSMVFGDGEYKKDPWKSEWREKVVWAVNHTVVEKRVAKKKFRLTDKDLEALKQELILYRCRDASKPRAMVNLAAAGALALRVHGGYLEYLAALNKHDLAMQKSAETRRRNRIAKDWVQAQVQAEGNGNAGAGDGQQGGDVTDAMSGPESESGHSSDNDSEDDEADVHLDGAGCARDVCRAQELWLGVGYIY